MLHQMYVYTLPYTLYNCTNYQGHNFAVNFNCALNIIIIVTIFWILHQTVFVLC